MSGSKLHNVEQWVAKRHVATLVWNKPYAICKHVKQLNERHGQVVKGTYFKIVRNFDPSKLSLSQA